MAVPPRQAGPNSEPGYCKCAQRTGKSLFVSDGFSMSGLGQSLPKWAVRATSASLIGRLGSSAFRLSAITVTMSLAGSCFSSESAPGPFHHGIRRRGGTIFTAALPSDERQVQADIRNSLIHRPARDIFPRLGGIRVFSYRIWLPASLMLLRRRSPSSTLTAGRPLPVYPDKQTFPVS